MFFRLMADLTVVVHVAFVLFVVLGGLLVIWRAAVAWVHLPAVAWGVWIELSGGICPLTPLENRLRALGGESVYDVSFVEQYLIPVLYPEALTRELQVMLGAFVVVVNAGVYAAVLARRRGDGFRRTRPHRTHKGV